MHFNTRRRAFGALCLLVLAGSWIVMAACDDHGLDQDFFPSVQGEIIISSPVPEPTDELVLALLDGTTPRVIKAIPRSQLNLTAATQTVPFVMEAEYGSFESFFVIWKERGVPLSVIENIVGSNCENDALLPINLTEENKTVNIDLEVNLSKVNRTAKVAGVIRFEGQWPNNIDNLGLVLAPLNALAGGLSVCNLLKNMDIRLLPESQVAVLPFEFKVAPGPTLLVVAWNRIGQPVYQPTLISPLTGVQAVADSMVTGIEIIANFGAATN